MKRMMYIYWSRNFSKIQSDIFEEIENPDITTLKCYSKSEVTDFSKNQISEYINILITNSKISHLENKLAKIQNKHLKDLDFSWKRDFCRMPHISIEYIDTWFLVSIEIAYKKSTSHTIPWFYPPALIKTQEELASSIESLIPLLQTVYKLCLEKSFDSADNLYKQLKKDKLYNGLLKKYPNFLPTV